MWVGFAEKQITNSAARVQPAAGIAGRGKDALLDPGAADIHLRLLLGRRLRRSRGQDRATGASDAGAGSRCDDMRSCSVLVGRAVGAESRGECGASP